MRQALVNAAVSRLSTNVLLESLKQVQQKLSDPAATPEEKLKRAKHFLSLAARPSFRKSIEAFPEARALATELLTAALEYLQQALTDPNIDADQRLLLSEYFLALFSRPGFLKALQTLAPAPADEDSASHPAQVKSAHPTKSPATHSAPLPLGGAPGTGFYTTRTH